MSYTRSCANWLAEASEAEYVTMKLSIIIPVFNVEPYLEECLSSVFSDTSDLSDTYEIVAVNDGSTDNSASVLELYSRQYANMHVISQENQGLSAARMMGLLHASGDFVWFVDSDDYLEPGAVAYLLKKIQEYSFADILVTPFKWNDGQAQSIRTDLENVTRGAIPAKEYFRRGYQTVGAQHFILRRSLFSNRQLFFPAGLLHEDAYFGKVLLYLAKWIVVLDKVLYNYRVRPGSIMTGRSIRSSYDLVKIYQMLYRFCKEDVDKKDRRWFLRNAVEGTLLESMHISSHLIGGREFSHFHNRNWGLIVREYLRCGANSPFFRLLGDLLFIIFPALYVRMNGEHRYISLHGKKNTFN